MKKTLIITLSICALALVIPTTAHAKGGKKNKNAASQPAADSAASTNSAAILAKYDSDKDGSLSDSEIDAMKKDFVANKNDILKQFDVNSDGKLDDSEIAALKASLTPPPAAKHKKKKSASAN
jgi:hypothetical protein